MWHTLYPSCYVFLLRAPLYGQHFLIKYKDIKSSNLAKIKHLINSRAKIRILVCLNLKTTNFPPTLAFQKLQNMVFGILKINFSKTIRSLWFFFVWVSMMILKINMNVFLIALQLGPGLMFQGLTFEFVFNNIGTKGTTKVTAFNFYCSVSQTGICRPLRIITLYLINVGWISKWLSSPQRTHLPVAEFGTFPSPSPFLLISQWQEGVLDFILSSMFHGREMTRAGAEMGKNLRDPASRWGKRPHSATHEGKALWEPEFGDLQSM